MVDGFQEYADSPRKEYAPECDRSGKCLHREEKWGNHPDDSALNSSQNHRRDLQPQCSACNILLQRLFVEHAACDLNHLPRRLNWDQKRYRVTVRDTGAHTTSTVRRSAVDLVPVGNVIGNE